MKIDKILIIERLKRNMTQRSLALKAKVSNATISRIESGEVTPDTSTLTKLSAALNVTPDYLLGRTSKNDIDIYKINNIMPINNNVVRMPIIGIISAGYDGLAEEEILGEIDMLSMSLRGYAPSECFVLRVKGNSMYPDYLNGDLVAIHKQSSVDSGAVAVVLYNGDEATLKKVRYKQGEDWLELIPRNPEYQTKRIEGADLEQCRILGKVLTLVYRDLK